ncbi:MAG: phosphoglucosamine mutase [Alphaproteobacteria bacterium]|nr:phosphoglucosamine mutase [Alphaproteobacteria bacterium]
MERKLFGTDGIRGTANRDPMTAEMALKVAVAAGSQFLNHRTNGHTTGKTVRAKRPLAVIGKDTRLSGYMLEPAMTAGFASIGMDVILVGPLPTPAVAMLTRTFRADLGIMLSASHNPFEDNGIKIFGPDGFKLSDRVEHEIERAVFDRIPPRAAPKELGRVRRLDDSHGRYIEFVKATFPRGKRLDGLKVVIDCANGAAYRVAPLVLAELGAEVIPIGIEPNGFNINDNCGAVFPRKIQAAVLEHNADIGLALDGDADRLIVADEKGAVVDGDQIIALIAKSWLQQDHLATSQVVTTVMSNLGLERYLGDLGIELIRMPVGDRYVVERMRSDGINLGGEQSGHIVMSDYGTTGDGLMAALQVLAAKVEADEPTSAVANLFTPLPQLLKNVRVAPEAMSRVLEEDSVVSAIAEAEASLGAAGRILIRKSGTEPLIRVMAEGENRSLIHDVVDGIVAAIAAVNTPRDTKAAS